MEDVVKLKDRLRSEDAEETIAAANISIEENLTQGFKDSRVCFCVEQDGVATALFGLIADSALGPTARVWLLGAPELNNIKKTFVRESRRIIKEWTKMYTLWGIVDARYKKAIRWLGSCGAVFMPDELFGPKGDKFILFEIGRI